MQTAPDAELRAFAREFAQSARGSAAYGAEPGGEYDPQVWRRIAGDLQLPGARIAEALGGADGSLADAAVFAFEFGRALTASPLLATATVVPSALAGYADDPTAAALLTRIADGSTTSTLVTGALDDRLQPSPAAVATLSGETWSLRGAAEAVLDGSVADMLLVLAETPDGPALFSVDGTAAGVTRRPLATLDLLRNSGDIRFEGAAALMIGEPGSGLESAGSGIREGLAMLVTEQSGAADGVLELAVEYARIREQFGRPIGSFQAIKHQIAEALVWVQLSAAAAESAVLAVAAGGDAVIEALSVAKLVCSRALRSVSLASIQIHGGIGVTWEHPCHLYLRRATASARLFGDLQQHRSIVSSRALT